VDEPSVLADLDALARAGLVRLGDEGWAPAHDVVADSVTELLERAERGRLHALLARALKSEGAEPSEVAKQLEGAGDARAAAEAFVEAARHSLARFSSAEAEQLAIAGLRNAQQSSLRSELLEIRAEARARRGDLVGARDDLRAALALTTEGPRRAHLLARMAALVSGSDDYAYAGELIGLALDEAGSHQRARAEALAVGAIVDFNTNRLERAEARSSEALALFEQVGDAQGSAEVLDVNAMIAFFQGRFWEAPSLLGRVVRLFEDSGKLLRLVTPRAFRGQALAVIGEPEQGLSEINQALELARTLGDPEAEAYCIGLRAFTLLSLGRAEEARQNAAETLQIARRLAHRELLAASHCFIGLAHEASGALEQAEASYRECFREATGLPLFSSWAASGLARVLIERGDLTAARECVDKAFADGPPSALFDARVAAVELAVAKGEPNAGQLAAEALSLAETAGHRLSVPRLSELVRQLDQNRVSFNSAQG
jgi:tetratricopeptide (TPR) repeat protein